MASDDIVDCVVMDNGSGFTKIGYSGEDSPRSIFATTVGVKQTLITDSDKDAGSDAERTASNTAAKSTPGNHSQDWVVGDHVARLREAEFKHAERVKLAQQRGDAEPPVKDRLLSVVRPVQFGEIKSWDEMEQLWEYSYTQELKIDPSSFPVLLTDVPLNDKKLREKMAQIMFEKFSVKGFYIQTQAVLSLFASGRTTGIIVESGHDVSHSVPIFEGYAIRHSILSMRLGGRHLTEFYTKELTHSNNFPFEKNNKLGLIRELKEMSCITTKDYDSAMRKGGEPVTHELPDGTVLKVPYKTRISCPEILFQPSMLETDSKNNPGIGDITSKSIKFCDKDLQRALYGSIVVAGGTSMIPGFADRLQQEVATSTGVKVAVHADSQRKCAAWIGGSMLASLPTFNHMKITKQEYDDSHAVIVHRKCF